MIHNQVVNQWHARKKSPACECCGWLPNLCDWPNKIILHQFLCANGQLKHGCRTQETFPWLYKETSNKGAFWLQAVSEGEIQSSHSSGPTSLKFKVYKWPRNDGGTITLYSQPVLKPPLPVGLFEHPGCLSPLQPRFYYLQKQSNSTGSIFWAPIKYRSGKGHFVVKFMQPSLRIKPEDLRQTWEGQ